MFWFCGTADVHESELGSNFRSLVSAVKPGKFPIEYGQLVSSR
jgi:hypothetical protein